jgi:GrpB-like predicted nucleotidyltransferase (UPF0157 family)
MTVDVDEPIHIVSFDPAWAELFAQEEARLRDGLIPQIVRFEHFGSTSVARMAGKPVVDLLVGVDDMPRGYQLAESIARLGYENLGEILWPGRIYLRRRGPPHFNAVIVVYEGDLWKYFITLRDYLRSHPAEVAEYTRARREAVDAGASTFLAYSHEKGPFLKGMSERALRWKFASLRGAAQNGGD